MSILNSSMRLLCCGAMASSAFALVSPTPAPTTSSFLFFETPYAVNCLIVIVSVAIGLSAASEIAASVWKVPGSILTSQRTDPLILIFCAQAIAVTARVQLLPPAYTDDFAGKFRAFNLEMDPPSWAQKFMRFGWAGSHFEEDETVEAAALSGHLFYFAIIGMGTFALHVLLLLISALTGCALPSICRLPFLEAHLFIAMSMGLLNVSTAALLKSEVSREWRLVAAIEVFLALCFLGWLYFKGREFIWKVIWVWNPRTSLTLTERERSVFRAFKKNGASSQAISLGEFLAQAHLIGRPNEKTATGQEIVKTVKLFRELDIHRRGLSEEDFRLGIMSHKLHLPEASILEGCCAFMRDPPNPILGAYAPSMFSPCGFESSTEPWGRLFQSFTPRFIHFYSFCILKAAISVFILNGFSSSPRLQSVLMMALNICSLFFVARRAVYVQRQGNPVIILNALFDAVVYVLVFVASLDAMSAVSAAKVIMIIQMSILAYNIGIISHNASKTVCASCNTYFVEMIRSKVVAEDTDSVPLRRSEYNSSGNFHTQLETIPDKPTETKHDGNFTSSLRLPPKERPSLPNRSNKYQIESASSSSRVPASRRPPKTISRQSSRTVPDEIRKPELMRRGPISSSRYNRQDSSGSNRSYGRQDSRIDDVLSNPVPEAEVIIC